MAFAGSKSIDDRRRRRLAAANDEGAPVANIAEPGLPLAELIRLASAGVQVRTIPGIPLRSWVLWTCVSGLATAMAGFLALVIAAELLPHHFTPLVERLLTGTPPKIVAYAEAVLWLAAGQLCFLVAWCRSRSQLDFAGRYRLWPRVGLCCFLASLCSATDLHGGLTQVLQNLTGWNLWRPHVLAWLVPVCVLAIPAFRAVLADMRGSTSSASLLRFAAFVCVVGLAADGFAEQLAQFPWVATSAPLWRLWGSFWLVMALWVHLRHVCYVCADPPEAGTSSLMRMRSLFGKIPLGSLFRFRRANATSTEKVVRKRRRKADAEEIDDSEETPKRTRKKSATAAKPKRQVKPRVRVPLDVDADFSDEGEADSSEETEDESEAMSPQPSGRQTGQQAVSSTGKSARGGESLSSRRQDEDDRYHGLTPEEAAEWAALEQATSPAAGSKASSSNSGYATGEKSRAQASPRQPQATPAANSRTPGSSSSDVGQPQKSRTVEAEAASRQPQRSSNDDEEFDDDYYRVDDGESSDDTEGSAVDRRQRREQKKQQAREEKRNRGRR